MALVDAASGQSWTFGDLRSRAAAMASSREVVREARGRGIGFIVDTLVAWRDEAVLCPCEDRFERPALPPPPAGAGHVKFTSGSTGTPRAVWLNSAQLQADVDQIVTTMGLRSDWPNLGVISLAHSYGFSNLVLPLLLHGIPLVLVKDALPGTMTTALSCVSQATLPAVPAMWRAWLGAGILSNGRIRLAISAGAPLTLALEQAIFEQAQLKVHNFYGASECGGIAYDRSETPRSDAAFVGTALEGVTLTLQDNRLCVTSPAVALGYAEMDDHSALRDGQFLTNDQAEIDTEGQVYLTGREGDTIHVAGRKVAPEVIEEALLSLAGVQHTVVFGVPSKDPERVDDIVAAIHLTPGASLEPLPAALRSCLPSWQCPRHWWLRQDLSPDARGKISRHAWRSLYLRASPS